MSTIIHKKFNILNNINDARKRIKCIKDETRLTTNALERMNYPKAAVLAAIFDHKGAPYIILTLRSSNLRSHKGHVTLPGGKQDDDDDVDIVTTAMRETEEEIGLNRKNLQVVGVLPPYFSVGLNLLVYPVIAILENIVEVHLKLNEEEVEDVFAMPLEIFMRTDFRHKQHFDFSREYTKLSHVYTFTRNKPNIGDSDVSLMNVSSTHNTDKTFKVFGLTSMMCFAVGATTFNDLSELKFSNDKRTWSDGVLLTFKYNHSFAFASIKPKL